MKIFATLTLTILVALLPHLHGKPMDDRKEQAIAKLLKAFLQEEERKEMSMLTDLAMAQDEFSLEVVDCDEITEEVQRSLSSYLSRIVSRKVTLTCSGTGSPPAAGGGTGLTYTRWGQNECPDVPGTELLYAGTMAGAFYNQKGGGSNYLCLPNDPDDGDLNTAIPKGYSRIYGTEYEFPIAGTHDHGVPCASCYDSTRSAQLMIPAKTVCPTGWTREYYGYLMSEANIGDRSRNEYICVDKEQVSLPGSAGNQNGNVIYHVLVACHGIHCPPYNTGKALTCTVCSK